MSSPTCRVLAAFLVSLAVMSVACGSLSPPESCADTGTASEEAFHRDFASMELVLEDSGLPLGTSEEGEAEASATDRLAIRIDSKGEVAVRACVEERKGGGEIKFDETEPLPQGEAVFELGSFEKGPYVIRVLVDGVLVKNFPFNIE